MKIKIISEGRGINTKIINAETGEQLEGVTSAKWECSANGLAMATLSFINVPVDVEGGKNQNVISGKT